MSTARLVAQTLDFGRPRIMGILNVTPDSFSDGGAYFDEGAAVARGLAIVAEGADVVDVGGESTRPGAAPVPAQEQQRRVGGVIRRLRAELDRGSVAQRLVALSIDTTLVEVAEAALDAGAAVLNDISAGRDPRNSAKTRSKGKSAPEKRESVPMFALAASAQATLVLMHVQGTPATMQRDPTYRDVVTEVTAFLLERAAAAQAAGVDRRRILLDPGLGFGKRAAHNLELVRHVDHLVATGYPVVLGPSRKRFLRGICYPEAAPGGPVEGVAIDLAGATAAVTGWGVTQGVAVFRVHDVRANRQAADVAWAIRGGR